MTGTRSRRAVFATFIAVVAIGTTGPIASAASFGPTKYLRTAGATSELVANEVEAQGRQLAVSWWENQPGQVGFIRLSEDGGQTFQPRIMRPQRVSLDVCDGRAWGLTVRPSGRVGIAGFPFAGGASVSGNYTGPTGAESAYENGRDLACVGGRRLAAAWLEQSTSPPHVQVLVRPYPGCVPCGSLPWSFHDIGTGQLIGGTGPYMDATYRDIYVAWLQGTTMKFKHFSVGTDENATVTAHPTLTLFQVAGGSRFSQVAARGSRVVLSYQDGWDTTIRISDNKGASFGPEIVVVDGHALGGVTEPTSLDLLGPYILVGILRQASTLGWGMLSTDGGVIFNETSSHAGGGQGGELFRMEGVVRIAEIWDQYYANPPFPKLKFHTGLP